ncbi:MAG: cell division protein FtsQ/DivIB [Pseudomonadota bacterium]|nr:cell division protein FtsQ/DivIB [Pseudomonadota bacterium]MDQ2705278.1 cell division protein FtsQ/DivIB [Pseudomonadota bacterium]
MFALKTEQSGEAGGPRPAFFGLALPSETFLSGRFVLPRFLRRPARLVSRLCDGEYAPPRFAGVIATAVFLSSSALYGAWLGGQIPVAAQAVTARLGFAVDQIRVSGNKETSEIDILGSLGLDGWTSLVGFDADAARQRITELPWVKVAAVRKIYPDEIEVRIEEREPFAIWQHGSQLAIVERSGNVIAPFHGGRLAALPLVIGYGAAEQAAGFVGKIRQYPGLAARVKGYIRVAERRWDLRLENGITIRLPETGEDAAIAEVLRLDRENGLLSRDIATVDLRLDDRLVIELTPEAMEQRVTLLAERAKAAKRKPGKNI